MDQPTRTEPRPPAGATRLNLAIAALALLAIVLWLIAGLAATSAAWRDAPLQLAVAVGGVVLAAQLVRGLLRGDLGADLIAGIAIVVAAWTGQWLAGALVVLMLSGGQALEELATARASNALRALADRMPALATRLTDGREETVGVDSLLVDDTVIVAPHDVCPADGRVLSGRTTMDEAFLTGEPWSIDKTVGSDVLAGAINGEGRVTITVTRPNAESRYSRILRVLESSEQSRPRIRRLADRLGLFYTPLALAIAGAAWWASGDIDRFLAVLVIATPCPLLIAIPVALLGSVSSAARRGILIRDPSILEELDKCEAMLLDKTGTLTHGRPHVSELVTAPGQDEARVLQLLASVERHSRHPLGRAIMDAAEARHLALIDVDSVSERPGEGLSAEIEGHSVWVTGRRHFLAKWPEQTLPPTTSGLECVVAIDGQFAALCRLHDEPRSDSASFIEHLGRRHGITKRMIISGDRLSEVAYLAERVGITDIRADQTPEQKVAIVAEVAATMRTVYVGDGINDAPALARAHVGIAFGKAGDAVAESAGAIILEPTLVKLDELLHIAIRFRRIAMQSAVGGMTLSVVGMAFAATGHLSPVSGAIGQEIIDVLAVLNALRTARLPADVHDFDAAAVRAAPRRG